MRNRYCFDAITAFCVVLRPLSSAYTWYDLETSFKILYSHFSEIFWEEVEHYVQPKGQLITNLQQELLQQIADMYTKSINDAGAPLDSCVGFIDYTKAKICRPGGAGSYQRACYSGHKRFNCLIYQKRTTPGGLIFSLFGPEVGRRHDMTLFRRSVIEKGL